MYLLWYRTEDHVSLRKEGPEERPYMAQQASSFSSPAMKSTRIPMLRPLPALKSKLRGFTYRKFLEERKCGGGKGEV